MLRVVLFLSVCATSAMGMDVYIPENRGSAQKNVRVSPSTESSSEIQFPVFTPLQQECQKYIFTPHKNSPFPKKNHRKNKYKEIKELRKKFMQHYARLQSENAVALWSKWEPIPSSKRLCTDMTSKEERLIYPIYHIYQKIRNFDYVWDFEKEDFVKLTNYSTVILNKTIHENGN